jgi:hypothetical protein
MAGLRNILVYDYLDADDRRPGQSWRRNEVTVRSMTEASLRAGTAAATAGHGAGPLTSAGDGLSGFQKNPRNRKRYSHAAGANKVSIRSMAAKISQIRPFKPQRHAARNFSAVFAS